MWPLESITCQSENKSYFRMLFVLVRTWRCQNQYPTHFYARRSPDETKLQQIYSKMGSQPGNNVADDRLTDRCRVTILYTHRGLSYIKHQ